MQCTTCGTNYESGTNCPSCGAPAAAPQVNNQAYAQPQQPYQNPGQPYGQPQQAYQNPGQPVVINNMVAAAPMASAKSRTVALLLCFFFGAIGVHRFYVGKIGTGVLYIFTVGGFGFGVLIDFIKIIVGTFRDGLGMPLQNW